MERDKPPVDHDVEELDLLKEIDTPDGVEDAAGADHAPVADDTTNPEHDVHLDEAAAFDADVNDDNSGNESAVETGAGNSIAAEFPLSEDGEIVQERARAAGLELDRADNVLFRKLRLIETDLDRLVKDLPADLSEAENLANETLQMEPPDGLMDALYMVAGERSDPVLVEFSRKLALLRLLVDMELRDLTHVSRLDPEALRQQAISVFTLIDRIKALRRDMGWVPMKLGPRDGKKIKKLQDKLLPTTDKLCAYGFLVPLVERLVRAVAEDWNQEKSALEEHELALITDSHTAENGFEPSRRVLIDAAALRCAVEEELAAWDRLMDSDAARSDGARPKTGVLVVLAEDTPPAAAGEAEEVPADLLLEPLDDGPPANDGDDETMAARATGEAAGDAGTAMATVAGEAADDPEQDPAMVERQDFEDRSQAMLERLRVAMTTCNVVLDRLQYQQDLARAGGDKNKADTLFSSQGALFAAYTNLSAAVRGPSRREGPLEDEAAAERARLFREAAEAEREGNIQERSNEEVFLEALTEMRDAAHVSPEVISIQLGDLKRERKRTRGLFVLALVLAALSLGVNFYFWDFGPPAESADLPLDKFAPAMPLESAAPLGPMMYAQVPAFNWEAMDGEERSRRVALLGQLAEEQGFDGVYVTDENKQELAHWTRAKGSVISETKPAPESDTDAER